MKVLDLCLPYSGHLTNGRGMSFELPKNKVSFLLGANGSGKSTLLKVLLGYLKPTKGSCSTQHLSARERTQTIAWVDQSMASDVAYSVAEVVALSGAGPEVTMLACEQLGIAELKHKALQQLSGGEQRRVHLARAFAQATPWLLMDEPNTHLDLASELQLLSALGELPKLNRSVLMATHNPAHIGTLPSDVLGLVIIMKDGQIALQCQASDAHLWKPKLCEVLGVNQELVAKLHRF